MKTDNSIYLLSVLLFETTAGHCKFPFHVILSDFVEANSGSALLITVLNKLGAVASKSSLNRHIMKNSAKHLEEGLLKLLKMILLLRPQLIILIFFKVMLLCP